ncbi:hypothetical protein HDU98_005316 [Podochytrium sp. JEL0797]|nr:hypothetical protein HDU98_005316 [Podochytrium sp. JEL0797]
MQASGSGKHGPNHNYHHNADKQYFEHKHQFYFNFEYHNNAYKQYHFEHKHEFHFIIQNHHNYFEHKHEFHFNFQDYNNAYKQYHFEHKHEFHFDFQDHNNAYKQYHFEHKRELHFIIQNHHNAHKQFFDHKHELSGSAPVLNPGAIDAPMPADRQEGTLMAKRQIDIFGFVAAVINDIVLLIDVVNGMNLPSSVQTNATSIPIGTYMCQNQTLFEMQATGNTTAAWTAQLTCSAATTCFISLAANQTQIGCRSSPQVNATLTQFHFEHKDLDNDDKQFHFDHNHTFHFIVQDHDNNPKHKQEFHFIVHDDNKIKEGYIIKGFEQPSKS